MEKDSKPLLPKLGYFVTMFPRLSETFILNEIIALEELGFSMTIYSRKTVVSFPVHDDYYRIKSPSILLSVSRPRDWIPTIKDSLIIFFKKPMKFFKTLVYVLKKKKRTAWRKFFIALRLTNRIYKDRIQHLHGHFAADNAKIVFLASKLSGVKFSFTAHAKDIWVKSTKSSLIKLIKEAEFVVTICSYNLKYLSELSGEPEKIKLVYNGLDLEKFNPVQRKPESKDPFKRLLAVGRLVSKKGFEHLIQACGILKEKGVSFQCHIVGEGEMFPELKSMIQRKKLEDVCHLRGPCSQEELIENFLSIADILIAPCIKTHNNDQDGIPTVIIEAMSMGIPVISTPVAGIPEVVIPEETGLMVPPGSDEDLAQAILSLIQDQDKGRSLGKAGEEKVRNMFDRSKNIKKLAALFLGEKEFL